MALADSKKIQTLINRAGNQIIQMRKGLAEIEDYRARLTTSGASETGTPLQGKIAQLTGFISALDSQLNGPIATTLVDNVVSSHRGEAL